MLRSPENRYLLDSQVSQAVAGYLKAVGFEVDLRVLGDWAGYIVDATVVCESWGRIAGGSAQCHEISSTGSKLVANGFV